MIALICSVMVRDSGTMRAMVLARSRCREVAPFLEGVDARRLDRLLYLGTAPLLGGHGQVGQIQGSRIPAIEQDMDAEDIHALRLVRQIHEKTAGRSVPCASARPEAPGCG